MTRLYRIEAHRQLEQSLLSRSAPGTLMSRAAAAVAHHADSMLRGLVCGQPESDDVLVLAGPGGNGADALLAALLLAHRGYRVSIVAVEQPARLNQQMLLACRQAGLNVHALEHGERLSRHCTLVIDGLLGVGQSRPLQGGMAQLVAGLAHTRAPILSVDLPTGLSADTGQPIGQFVVHATRTVTLLTDKPGLRTGEAARFVGVVVVEPLDHECIADDPVAAALPARTGVQEQPVGLVNASAPHSEPIGTLFGDDHARALLPRRGPTSHKGTQGSVLIAGGATSMQGAAMLAAQGAQASGPGKIFLTSPNGPLQLEQQPQWMSRSWPPSLSRIDVVVAGCGLGASDAARTWLADWLGSSGGNQTPRVLDADALNWLSDNCLTRLCWDLYHTVMTPHPLEAARLLHCEVADIQADRIEAAVQLAHRFGAISVLKGPGTIVAAPEGRWAIIQAGAPTLATAGSGDVLAGLIGGLLAQGLTGWDAACLGAWAHGRAGELMQQRLPLSAGLRAAELFEPIRALLNGR